MLLVRSSTSITRTHNNGNFHLLTDVLLLVRPSAWPYPDYIAHIQASYFLRNKTQQFRGLQVSVEIVITDIAGIISMVLRLEDNCLPFEMRGNSLTSNSQLSVLNS
jgi:hypothetical protein